ncbi:MAG: M14 family zinc carboxypeptidase [Bdellovibrionota bacterium]
MRGFKNSILVVVSAFLLLSTTAAESANKRLINHDETLNRYVIHYPVKHPKNARGIMKWLTRNRFDVAGVNWRKGTIEVITNDEGVRVIEKALRKREIRGKIVEKQGGGFQREDAIDQRYLNPERLTGRLKALNEEFPEITRLEQIGKSNEGRPIWALLVSSTPKASDPKALAKPSILFDGMHHAREIMTPEIVLDVAESLLRGVVAQNRRAEQLLTRWNVWVVPMLNVDGNHIVWTKNNWWRKNARSEGNKVFGVDINRNYPYRWGDCNGSSSMKSSDTYRGESASSEPETQALINLAMKIRPAASLSYHSYGELILYPFSCEGDLTGENELLKRVAGELSERLPSDRGQGNYTTGTSWQILYAVDGASKDFMFAAFGALAYTFEVNQAFQPPYELRNPTLKKHRVAWKYFLDRIDRNLLKLNVVDGTTGESVLAQLSISTIAHKKGERPFETNKAGYFFKVLDPGTYTITARLEDGRSGKLSVEMLGSPKEATLTVQ